MIKTFVSIFILLVFNHLPAYACLSCGCGSSGSSADLGALGGASSLFGSRNRWLIQSGVNIRHITGSINERGQWFTSPEDSLVQSYGATFGINYFTDFGLGIGIQLPFQANVLKGAHWGAFGSLQASAEPQQWGSGIGDIQVQASYKWIEETQWGLATWASLSLPTGKTDPNRSWNTTGSGMPAIAGGLMALLRPTPSMNFSIGPESQVWWETLAWEFLVNLGYSQVLGSSPQELSPFFIGQSVMGQIQGNLVLAPSWVAGMGLSGQLGFWSSTPDQTQTSWRWRLMPSLQHELSPDNGLRFAVGIDLALGQNTLSDITPYLVYYQFF